MMTKKTSDAVEVIFRKYDDGEVLALFPGIAGTMNPYICSCYVHVGQHGKADPHYSMSVTNPATPEEYSELQKELEGIGYRLKVIKRLRPRHLEERREELARLCRGDA